MKAFILAAGNGTRLRPMTDLLPKCLVPIGGVPMLQIWLETCQRHGVREVTINLHSHASAVKKFLSHCPVDVAVRIFEEERLLGSAGTLRANREWIGNADFGIFYGDVLTMVDVSKMVEFHHAAGQLATLGLYEVANPRACGIAAVDAAGTIINFVEKPEHPIGNLGFSGVMIASPRIVGEIPAVDPADIGFHLLPQLVGRMAGYRIREYVRDIGDLAAYTSAQTEWVHEKSIAQVGLASGQSADALLDRRMQPQVIGRTSC